MRQHGLQLAVDTMLPSHSESSLAQSAERYRAKAGTGCVWLAEIERLEKRRIPQAPGIMERLEPLRQVETQWVYIDELFGNRGREQHILWRNLPHRLKRKRRGRARPP